jgi:hypothetical protein
LLIHAMTVVRARRCKDERGLNCFSADEAAWRNGLYARERRREIAALEIEPSYRIPRDEAEPWVCTVKADARFLESGAVRVQDYKGWAGDTPVSRLKRRLVAWQHGVEIDLVGRYIEQKARAKAKRQAERALLKRAKSKVKP